MDLGAVLGRPFKDSNWLTTCAKAGVLILIPLVGGIALGGWTKRVAAAYLRGEDQLPDPFVDIGGDIRRGFSQFLMTLVVFSPVILLMCTGVLTGIVMDEGGLGAIVILLAYAVGGIAALVMQVLFPAIMCAHLRTGDIWVLPELFRTDFRRILSAPVDYLMLLVVVWIAGMVGGIGTVACYVGLLVTFPLSLVMSMAAYVSWLEKEGVRQIAGV